MAGRDGRLVVVSCDVARCVSAGAVAPTLQAALDHSARSAPRLPALAGALDAAMRPASRSTMHTAPRRCSGPTNGPTAQPM